MFSKSKDVPATVNPPLPAASARAARTASSAPSLIGSDVRIVGDISTAGEVQLDGIVDGDVHAAALTMGESGALKGTIVAEKVVIRGQVEGSIRGRTVVLERSARVMGDVFHESLSIEAGAVIDGRFSHTEDPMGKKGASPKSATTGKAEEAKPMAPKPGIQVVEGAKA
ncbi:MAG: bactofilin family protein [Pseudomonadota bacterium]|jgi:cytoskeletal protein CcmA (bactofilin family)